MLQLTHRFEAMTTKNPSWNFLKIPIRSFYNLYGNAKKYRKAKTNLKKSWKTYMSKLTINVQ